jgi:DNA-binding NtrC family response regulator
METSILLIDQETILIEPLNREFGGLNLLLRVASSIADAERLVEEFPPDIVILDADMPHVPAFINRLGEMSEPILLIGLTGHAEKRIQLHALGIETIILKREGPQPVLDAVRHYIDPDAPPATAPDERSEILVVDDEEDFLTLFAKMLEMWGYTPLTAADGDTALEIVDTHPGVAAVLLDLRLPGKGGMEVLREIQKRNPKIGVIMLSGLADREIARQAIKLGAFDYVTKPPDFPTLQSTIIACLSHMEYQAQSWWKKLMG